MESAISNNILPQKNKVSVLNLSGKVKMVKNYIYYITCSSKNYENESTSHLSSITKYKSQPKKYLTPSYRKSENEFLKIESIEIDETSTKITFCFTNNHENGWMNISKDAAIIVDNEKYELIREEGINISPNRIYFSHKGETKTFSLYFFKIPSTVKTIDFIESPTSTWKIWGIQLE